MNEEQTIQEANEALRELQLCVNEAVRVALENEAVCKLGPLPIISALLEQAATVLLVSGIDGDATASDVGAAWDNLTQHVSKVLVERFDELKEGALSSMAEITEGEVA